MKISFGSSYTVNKGRNFPQNISKYLDSLKDQGAYVLTQFPTEEETTKTGVRSIFNTTVPDEMDKTIEMVLKYHGIKFQKTRIEDALNIENILSRIQLGSADKNTHTLVEMDVEILNELFKKNENTYVGPQGANGIKNRYPDAIKFLKLGRPINASTISLSEDHNGLQLKFDDGRHRFAVLRDMGIKKLPIALRKESFAIAEKYGLI